MGHSYRQKCCHQLVLGGTETVAEATIVVRGGHIPYADAFVIALRYILLSLISEFRSLLPDDFSLKLWQ
ncbi:hypothetical protein TNCV_4641901 [Trichonephila clavipes]|nr:hypothetical protein TNCV_4641901 [Trichonephila clavipes]